MKIVDILYDKIRTSHLKEWLAHNNNCREYNLYSSIDIRHSGFKIAPVDVNLFPAGFNNFSQKSLQSASAIVRRLYKGKKFLIIPEDHNRNLHYNDNVLMLKRILELAGNEVVISHDGQMLATNGSTIETEPVIRRKNILESKDGYIADIILLNNDMINGVPEILLNIEQKIIPTPQLGWFNRSKFHYFDIYTEVVTKFCQDFSIDSWLINTITNTCKETNIHKKEGLECVALKVEKMLKEIQDKYNEYSIKDTPYIFIKADNGSYGMGVITVFHAEAVFNLNKNTRKKMSVTKGKSKIKHVLLQEGIPTINSYKGCVAEPVIYCVSDQPISSLYRFHEHQCHLNNLNKAGAQFAEIPTDNTDKFTIATSIISSLALLATSIELEHYNDN